VSVLTLQNATIAKAPGLEMTHLNWTMSRGQHWAVAGPTGAGKTTLLRFNEQPAEINLEAYYYQQRYHASQSHGLITAGGFLQANAPADQMDSPVGLDMLHRLGLAGLLPLEFIKLSNGQRRKLLIAKALLGKPQLLLLDNPYTGLDTAARAELNLLIDQLAAEGRQIVLVSPHGELPACITHVLLLDQLQIVGQCTRAEYLAKPTANDPLPDLPPLLARPPLVKSAPPSTPPPDSPEVVRLSGVTVTYQNGPPVLQDLNWTVRQGEKWALVGGNGSGKSTLLALLYADHPQA
jgi:molybdate transport system ATP-binding protein